jgi:hypothetical protein
MKEEEKYEEMKEEEYHLPVASKKFLLKDLIKNYSNNSEAIKRYNSNKVDKDINRYEKLKSIINGTNININLNVVDLGYLESSLYYPYLDGDDSKKYIQYAVYFLEIINENKKKKIKKSKIKFSYIPNGKLEINTKNMKDFLLDYDNIVVKINKKDVVSIEDDDINGDVLIDGSDPNF